MRCPAHAEYGRGQVGTHWWAALQTSQCLLGGGAGTELQRCGILLVVICRTRCRARSRWTRSLCKGPTAKCAWCNCPPTSSCNTAQLSPVHQLSSVHPECGPLTEVLSAPNAGSIVNFFRQLQGHPVMVILAARHNGRDRHIEETRRFITYCLDHTVDSAFGDADKFVSLFDLTGEYMPRCESQPTTRRWQ